MSLWTTIVNWWNTTKCPTCRFTYRSCEDCNNTGRVDKRLVNNNRDTLPWWIGDPPSKRRRMGDSANGFTEVPDSSS